MCTYVKLTWMKSDTSKFISDMFLHICSSTSVGRHLVYEKVAIVNKMEACSELLNVSFQRRTVPLTAICYQI